MILSGPESPVVLWQPVEDVGALKQPLPLQK